MFLPLRSVKTRCIRPATAASNRVSPHFYPSDVLSGARRQLSSNAKDDMKIVYVHPLSQIVLECLQSNYSEWLIRRNLHSNTLSFHRDGTFEIKFPTTSIGSQSDRLWTSFDDTDKKHWLTVKRGHLLGRYLLQDNLMPAWNRGRSLPERIETAVNEMVEEIEAFEARKNKRRV